MKAFQVRPNRILAAVLEGDKLRMGRTLELMVQNLRHTPRERLQAAKDALDDFESTDVELTGLCQNVRNARKRLTWLTF